MRGFHLAVVLATLCASPMGYALQAATGTTAAPSSPAQIASPTPVAPSKSGAVSAVLKPSLDATWETAGSLQLEKWKRSPVRDEATEYIASIRHDVESTLPELLQAADANPGAMSKLLPVSGNINALYDVVLRVVNAARVAAPSDQFAALQEALANLEKARHELDNRIQDAAATQEKRISDLQLALKTQAQATPVCPAPAPVTPAATPAKKPTPRKRKPAPKPTTTPTATNPQPNGTAKPNQ